MTRTKVLGILHPWQTAADERRAFAATAVAAAKGAPVEVLNFTGNTHPAAVAERVAQQLGHATPEDERVLVLLPTGVEGESIAAEVAARLAGVNLGRCNSASIAAEGVTATRAAFGGRVSLCVQSTDKVTCATMRPQPTEDRGTTHGVLTDIAMQDTPPFPVRTEEARSGLPRVEGASIVVSGGRGMEGPEGFEWLARIATALGAGLGGSLPAVDSGWVPVAHQVGQSGKFVTPRLYLAVAISGTPQHMAGVAPTARILALNKDPSASIFDYCDWAVEGDWREILPLLARELEGNTARS
jgi:electron transfer flavoprotein alpha subunit